MKTKLIALFSAPVCIFAHSGHGAVEGHGAGSHLLLGLLIALPLAAGAGLLLSRSRRKAVVKVTRQD